MGVEIVYQNPLTGAVHELKNIASSALWKTHRQGAPAAVEIAVLHHPDIVIENGGIISVKSDNKPLFYGYVFRHEANERGELKFTAYDQIRYLKNKDTYVFKGKRADEILLSVAGDFKLKTGEVEDTGYVIPILIHDGKALIDLIGSALDHTIANTHQMYVLWDNFGSLTLSSPKKWVAGLILGDGSLVSDYTYKEDIDEQTFNKIKLVRDNKETGKRDVYVFQDSDTMKLWGTLQDYQSVDEGFSPAMIKDRGDKLIKLYNKPKQTFQLRGISDLGIRAGMGVYIDIKDIGRKGFHVVESCTHDLLTGRMEITVLVV